MELGELAAHQESVDNATAGFPSAEVVKATAGDDTEKPSGFEDQGDNDKKDSEDAESFDDDKQKSQILNELDMCDEDDAREPPKLADEAGDKVSEKSNDDEDDQRRKEIE